MNELKQAYLNLQPNVKTIFVTPSIERTKSHNSYLYLLYKNMIYEKDTNIKSIRVADFPKLVIDRLKGNVSILHHHWFGFHDLKSFMILIWTFFWMLIYKSLGGKIVWTVHNKLPHQKCCIRTNTLIRSGFAKFVDKIHVHCNKAIEIMQPILKVSNEKFFVVKHPNYEIHKLPKDEANRLLIEKYSIKDIHFNNKTIFLVFGTISPYKGIPEIIDLFNSVEKQSGYTLLIAGSCKNKDLKNEITKRIKSNINIIIIDTLIPEEDIDLFFNSTEYVIFNYSDILTSGGAALAMSYNKKIIAPNLGCLSNLQYDKIILFDKLSKDILDKCIR